MSPHGPHTWVTLLAVFLGALGHGLPIGAAPKWPSKLPPEQNSCIAHVTNYDIPRWAKAGGWMNGLPFDGARSAENILFEGGDMVIQFGDTERRGEPYSSGNSQTAGFSGHDYYEASFSPIPV
jgi:hypothetical protein